MFISAAHVYRQSWLNVSRTRLRPGFWRFMIF